MRRARCAWIWLRFRFLCPRRRHRHKRSWHLLCLQPVCRSARRVSSHWASWPEGFWLIHPERSLSHPSSSICLWNRNKRNNQLLSSRSSGDFDHIWVTWTVGSDYCGEWLKRSDFDETLIGLEVVQFHVFQIAHFVWLFVASKIQRSTSG